MPSKTQTGRKGEQMACDFLTQKGYDILHRNYRHKRAEIDLIVRQNNLLVFVEVKARSSHAFGLPEQFVDDRKAERIVTAADHFIFENNWQGNIRFDIIAITFKPEPEICHLKDAFY